MLMRMKSMQIILSLCLLLGQPPVAHAVASISIALATSQSPAPDQTPTLNAANSKDGCEFVSGMAESLGKWRDYSCDSDLINYYSNKVTHSGGGFFFKENQVRIQIRGGGFRDGTVIVKHKDGSVTGKGGLALGFMKINLDPDSRMLKLPDGDNVVKSDLPSVVEEVVRDLGRGYACRVSTKTTEEAGLSNPVFIVEECEKSSGRLLRRIFVDSVSHIPARIHLFRGEVKCSTATFLNVRVNGGLKDDLFNM